MSIGQDLVIMFLKKLEEKNLITYNKETYEISKEMIFKFDEEINTTIQRSKMSCNCDDKSWLFREDN